MARGDEADVCPVFERPPVRGTRLSLAFTQSSHIKGTQVATLYARWLDAYDAVEEGAPDPDEIYIEGDVEPSWPLPLVRFISEDATRLLVFQESRLDVFWRSLEHAPAYPGFESLASELELRFSELRESVEKYGDIELRVKSAACENRNIIEDPGGAVAVGVLTGWKGTPASELPTEGYVGVRIHSLPGDGNHHCSSLVSVDYDTDDAPELSIRVERQLDEGLSAMEALRDAHNELNKLFLKFTNEEQHDRWGRTA